MLKTPLIYHSTFEDERDSGYTSDTSKKTRDNQDMFPGEVSSPLSSDYKPRSGLADKSPNRDVKHGFRVTFGLAVSAGGDTANMQEEDDSQEDREVRGIMERGGGMEEHEGEAFSPELTRFPEITNRPVKNSLLSQITHFTVQSNPAHSDVLEITRSISVCSDNTDIDDNHNPTKTSIRTSTGASKTNDLHSSRDMGKESVDLWQTNNESSARRLPELKCSMYRVIGEPQLKRRPDRRKVEKQWQTPRLVKLGTVAGNKHNEVDTRTIYSKKNADLWQTITNDDETLLPPLVTSPRFQALHPEAGLVKEKGVIMKDFFSTGKMGRFAADKAIIPTVYQDFFESPHRKKMYVGNMYTDSFKHKHERDCKKLDSAFGGEGSHEYCDVMGNKYCASCIEFKNKHFALGYEKSLAPSSVPRQNNKTGLTNGMVLEMSKSLAKYEIESKQSKKEVMRQMAALALSPRRGNDLTSSR